MSVPYAGFWTGCRARFWGPETEYGVFEGGTEVWLPFGRDVKYSASPELNIESIPDVGYQHPISHEGKAKLYRFSISFKVQDPTIFPFIVGDGASFALTDSIKSFHAQFIFSPPDATGDDIYHTYYGCKIDQADFKVVYNGFWECTLAIIAKTLVADKTTNPAAAWTNETAQTGAISGFHHTSVYMDEGGAEAEEPNISEISLSFKNNLEPQGCVSGYEVRGLTSVNKVYGGSLMEIFEDNAQAERFTLQTALVTVRIHVTNWTAGNKNIWYHNCKFYGSIPSLEAGAVSKNNVPFEPTITATQDPVTFS